MLFKKINHLLFYDASIVFTLMVAFFLLLCLTPRVVGDGGEYYALYFALKDTLKPFMSDASWTEFSRFAASNDVLMPPNYVEFLRKAFPVLTLGSTGDFNHFWFYSLIVALVSGFLGIFSIHLSAHSAFIVTHWILFCIPCIIANRLFGWKGVLSVVIVTILSPIFWYVDKVHTEFFTYCLTLNAVIFFIRRYYIFSFLFLSMAATQNISFSAVALIPLIIDFFDRKTKEYSYLEMGLIILGVIIAIIHPAYYFFRYGVITPQLLAGGAKVGGNFGYFYIWLIDPDVGLLPNWPLGIGIILAIFIATRFRARFLEDLDIKRYWMFFLGYLVISLFAQSSTENLNSGATPSISRYALWYIPLFFPFLIIIIPQRLSLDFIRSSKYEFSGFFVFILCCALHSYIYYKPNVPSDYGTPSLFSYWIQKELPSFYNPPVEIFAERFGRVIGDPDRIFMKSKKVLAILGPDCKKILLLNIPAHDKVIGQRGCGYDYDRLVNLLKEYLYSGTVKKPVYIRLTESEVDELFFNPQFDVWYPVKHGDIATDWLRSGWSNPENFGTWSNGALAELSIPCPKTQKSFKLEFEIAGFIIPQHPVIEDVSIMAGDKMLYSDTFSGDLSLKNLISVDLPETICSSSKLFDLQIKINKPVSPLELGFSADPRKLGVALIKLRYVKNALVPAW